MLTVKKIDKDDMKGASLLLNPNLAKDTSVNYYKIILDGQSTDKDILTHPISLPNTVDKLSLIEKLLTFEGDKRLCALPMSNHNPLSSRVYMGELTDYSIQLEALFLINQIYFDKPFNYSPYPLLKDKRGNQESIDGVLLKQAYKHYRSWLDEVRDVGGIIEAKKKGLVPLGSSHEISWYD